MKVQIRLSGVNLNRIYKECEKQQIMLYNVDRRDYKNISFFVELKDRKKIKIIAKSQNYKYFEDVQSGFGKISNLFKTHIGLLIGSVIFAIVLFALNLFVWDIKIYGNQKVGKAEILQVLDSCNARVGCLKNDVEIETLEKALVNNIDEISMCSVTKIGTKLIVNIKEKISSLALENFQTETDIVALQNMTIRELEVVQGTAQKKVGDSVKKGEVIVAGYFFDVNGNKVNCKAYAHIKATIWHSNATEYQKQKEVFTRTGKKFAVSKMSIFGMDFVSKTKSQKFDFFETEETTEYAFKNNFLPVKYQKTIFYEVTKALVKQNFEIDRQKVIEQNEKLAFEKLKDDQIVSKIFSQVEEFDDYFLITSFVQVDIEL